MFAIAYIIATKVISISKLSAGVGEHEVYPEG